MRTKVFQKVPPHRIGRINKNNVKIEPHEDSTIVHLSQFGIDIELVKPKNGNKIKNADIYMMGSLWEMKSPTSNKEDTIKKDFRKASSQSDRVIFDLRRIRKNSEYVEKCLIKIFSGRGRVRKIMIIRHNGEVIEFYK